MIIGHHTMLRSVLVITLTVLSSLVGIGPGTARTTIQLDALTVPAGRLPSGCTVSSAPPVGLQVAKSPWIGDDPAMLASIRQRIGPSPNVPDGPPENARQLAQLRLAMTRGIEEGYAAVYKQAAPELVIVYGVRFSSPAGVEQLMRDTNGQTSPRIIRVRIGPVFAAVHGDAGPCAQAIGAYFTSLATPSQTAIQSTH
jgi:hypothetical protein